MKGIVERVDPVDHEIDFQLLAMVPVTSSDIHAIRQQLRMPDQGDVCWVEWGKVR
ncbi:MAG: hypothetical protein PHS77_11845 [Gallionellaceae bacterium]|nr:hypothetical protein [Gallionellaceae bacterium]